METTTILLKLMSLPTSRFSGVCKTSDGYYMGQLVGDVGYNAFLGKPKPPHPGPGRDYMLATWNGLGAEEKAQVLLLAARPMDGMPIDLHKDFGVPLAF